MIFAEKFDFSKYKTFCDAGGALGALSVEVAKKQEHIKCISFDLPKVAPVANNYIQQNKLSDRVKTASGSFFENIPNADVIAMGNILHDWSESEKLTLMKTNNTKVL